MTAEYSGPPEGLADQVVEAVGNRLENPTFVEFLGLRSAFPLVPGKIRPLPVFALAIQQRISLKQLQQIRSPSSWGFLIELQADSDQTDTTETVFATATLSSDGYRYSSILKLPDSLRLAHHSIEIWGKEVALLQVPTYYLEALWLRMDNPDEDKLAFFKEPFGRFPVWTPISPEVVPLASLVNYLNERLDKGDAAPTVDPSDSAD